jgi:transposase InsO family protein
VGVYLNGDGLNDAYNDVYVCDKGSIIEIVIRHSDEGSDYWSGSVFKKEEEK